MAWIVVDLEDTLLMDIGDGTSQPVDGAAEAMMRMAGEGHRLTIFTDRFAPMPEARKQQLREEIESELVSWGFPPMEVWTGTTKPAADLFLGAKAVTFDGDWPLALAQMQVMLEERGLAPGALQDDGSLEGLEGGEQMEFDFGGEEGQ